MSDRFNQIKPYWAYINEYESKQYPILTREHISDVFFFRQTFSKIIISEWFVSLFRFHYLSVCYKAMATTFHVFGILEKKRQKVFEFDTVIDYSNTYKLLMYFTKDAIYQMHRWKYL